MFVPLGLLLAAWVAPQPRRRIELPALLVAGLLGCLWAMGVNFAQLWFPSRTVSLNNLAAEFFGVIGGGLLWSTLGATGLRCWRQLASGGRISLKAALSGYVVLYVVASLTPFDFITSSGEIAEKAASNLYGLWLAPVGCGPAPCKLKFLSVMFAAVPCGWWFAARRRSADNIWLPAVLVALVVATILELLHFLLVLCFHPLPLLVLFLLEVLQVFLALHIGLWIYISDGIFSPRRRLPRVGWFRTGRGREIGWPIRFFRLSGALGRGRVVRSRRLC